MHEVVFIRSLLFSDITKRIVVIPYRSFGTTYWSIFKGPGTYRSHHQGSRNFLTLEVGTDTFSRNVGKELPLYAA